MKSDTQINHVCRAQKKLTLADRYNLVDRYKNGC